MSIKYCAGLYFLLKNAPWLSHLKLVKHVKLLKYRYLLIIFAFPLLNTVPNTW